MFPHAWNVHHAGDVAFPKRIAQEHSAVQEGGVSEAAEFISGWGKGGDLKGVLSLWVQPIDGPVLQVSGESDISGG